MTDVRIIGDKVYMRTSTLVNSNHCEKVYEARNIQNPKDDVVYWHVIHGMPSSQEKIDDMIYEEQQYSLLCSWINEIDTITVKESDYYCITKTKDFIVDTNKLFNYQMDEYKKYKNNLNKIV